MGSETYHASKLDEIKVGDRLLSSGPASQQVYEVVERDVVGEMNIVGGDGYERTAGVRVRQRGQSYTRDISYRTLVETNVYRVSRDWSELTDEQIEAVRAEA